uniref:Cadherin_5 domain-containing protein n=1 Tax=Heterorhabditis bacteriophora TaxID=37862 RepID=A0A1I7W8Z6_HETBA
MRSQPTTGRSISPEDAEIDQSDEDADGASSQLSALAAIFEDDDYLISNDYQPGAFTFTVDFHQNGNI